MSRSLLAMALFAVLYNVVVSFGSILLMGATERNAGVAIALITSVIALGAGAIHHWGLRSGVPAAFEIGAHIATAALAPLSIHFAGTTIDDGASLGHLAIFVALFPFSAIALRRMRGDLSTDQLMAPLVAALLICVTILFSTVFHH